MLAFLLIAMPAQAQTIQGCTFDFTKILCKYDDNGNRIFRGFPCILLQEKSQNTETSNANDLATAPTLKILPTLKIQIFPNPTVSEATLTFAEQPPAGAILYVYDTQGKILVEQYADAQQMRISLAPFPSATYFVSILHEKQVLYNTKIIKTDR